MIEYSRSNTNRQNRADERREVDLAEPINRLKALAPLRDPAVFGRVQVGEWGHSLVWEGEIDLGADRLYEHCLADL